MWEVIWGSAKVRACMCVYVCTKYSEIISLPFFCSRFLWNYKQKKLQQYRSNIHDLARQRAKLVLCVCIMYLNAVTAWSATTIYYRIIKCVPNKFTVSFVCFVRLTLSRYFATTVRVYVFVSVFCCCYGCLLSDCALLLNDYPFIQHATHSTEARWKKSSKPPMPPPPPPPPSTKTSTAVKNWN